MLSRGLRFLTIALLGLSVSWASAKGPVKRMEKKEVKPRLRIESPAFRPGTPIPRKFTCEGQNVSPALSWSGEPEGTKSVALVVDDPDAPSKIWVHWVIFNIPSGMGELPENAAKIPNLMNGTRQGMNDSRGTGWDGPCPPRGGPHRYYFHLYALDTVLGLGSNWTKDQLMAAMKGHVLAEGSLMGTYQR